jgi:RHS repeat-associated protein
METAGNVIERYRYDSYGKVTVLDTNGNPNPTNPDFSSFGNCRTFTGQTLDIETCCMYLKRRYCHAIIGRFVSRDPKDSNYSKMEHSLNMYEYVNSSPVVFTDPNGLVPEEHCFLFKPLLSPVWIILYCTSGCPDYLKKCIAIIDPSGCEDSFCVCTIDCCLPPKSPPPSNIDVARFKTIGY